jgi:AraC-like DNA-binding protein
MDHSQALQSLFEQTLRFHWYAGGVTAIGSHTTGWRSSPGSGMVQIHDLRTKIELPDQPPCYAESGSAIVLDSQTNHCFTSTTAPTATIGCCRWGHIDFHILGGISVLSLFTIPMIVHGADAQVVGDACARLVDLNRHPPGVALSAVVHQQAFGLSVLSMLLKSATVNERGLMLLTHATRLQGVLGWIDEHLDQEADRESLARLAGLSPSRFHALFQLVMHRSPMAYLVERRMKRAQQMLLTGSSPVQAIASAVGYQDPFHFSRSFKRFTGESPQHYREAARLWLQQTAAKREDPR